MSTWFARYLLEQNQDVLAIDADHNMDFLFNLAGEQTDFPYLGEAGERFAKAIDLQPRESYQQRLARELLPFFSLSPRDFFTESVTRPLSDRLRLMVAGPHTEEVRQGSACSHILAAPLKVYLPLLRATEGQSVVVDSTAGMDMVGTGIATGMDLVFICTEPTVHGTKTAKQIAEGLDWYQVPHAFVLTKKQTEAEQAQTDVWLGAPVRFSIPFGMDQSDERVKNILNEMTQYVQEITRSSGDLVRRERAIRAAKAGVDFFQKKA